MKLSELYSEIDKIPAEQREGVLGVINLKTENDMKEVINAINAQTVRFDAKFDAMRGEFDAKFNEVDTKFKGIDTKFDALRESSVSMKWVFRGFMVILAVIISGSLLPFLKKVFAFFGLHY